MLFLEYHLIPSLLFFLCYYIGNFSGYSVFQGCELSLLSLLMKYAWVSCKLFVSSFPDDVFLVLFGFLLLTFVVSPPPTKWV